MPEDVSITSPNPSLSDEQLAASHPAVLVLVREVEDVARRDPSQGVQQLAQALSAYFRTPD